MLDDDFLGGENNVVPAQGEAIIHNDFSTLWQVETARSDGFHLQEDGI